MIRKMLQAILCIVLCPLLIAQQSVTKPDDARRPKDTAVLSQVLKLGVGQKISVREQGGVELNGTITGIGPTAFQLERRDGAAPTYVYYADVARVRRAHRHLVQFGRSSAQFSAADAYLLIVVAVFAAYVIKARNS